VRGTRVRLVQPAGFAAATGFPGFQQDDTGASIVVAEVPGPYAAVTADFTADGLRPHGLTLVQARRVVIADRPGLLLHVTQVARGTTFAKWIAAFGDDTASVLITATFPEELGNALAEPLRAAVLSACWDRGEGSASVPDLGFTLDHGPALRPAGCAGTLFAYTPDGTLPAASPTAPVLLAGRVPADVRGPDLQQFAEQCLTRSATMQEVAVETAEALTLDGLSGYEIVAGARDPATNLPLLVYQVTLFDGANCFLLQGLVGDHRRSEYLDEFRRMARTFTRTGAAASGSVSG
jgi:hypothetical protein